MKKYLLKEIANMNNLSIEEARVWIDAEIEAGNWEIKKTQKHEYFIHIPPVFPWHDIFNLRQRKPNGQALKDYKKLCDKNIYK
jgi:hypothetical protein